MFDIRELRLKKAVTQTELANYIGVSLRTVQHWEKGSRNITVGKLERIDSFFGLNMNLNAYEDFKPESLFVSESSEEYILNKENSDKIKILEETIRLKDEQLKFLKEQVDFLRNNVIASKKSI